MLSDLLNELDWGTRELCVRINKTGEGYSKEDLDAVSKMEKINSIVLPKIESESSRVFERTGKKIIALIETSRGLVRLGDIAESKRPSCDQFWTSRLCKFSSRRCKLYSSNLYVRTAIVAAARANDLDPIDGVYFDLANLQGFRAEAMSARELGYSGKQVVHPSQISVANEVFSPSEGELSGSKEDRRDLRERKQRKYGSTASQRSPDRRRALQESEGSSRKVEGTRNS